MKIIKRVLLTFYYLFFLITYGFYFYIRLVISLLMKLFSKSSALKRCDELISRLQIRPSLFVILIVFICSLFFIGNIIYINSHKVIDTSKYIKDNYKRKSNDFRTSSFNLLSYYRKSDFDKVNLDDVNDYNKDSVLWLMVDGTYINYPIVKSNDNSFYNTHSFDKKSNKNGWPYMDYRNSTKLIDNNIIFYGKDLDNYNSFSSLELINSEDWLNDSNKRIVLFTNKKKYVYRVYSIYYDINDTFKKINYKNKMNFMRYLNESASKSLYNFGVEFNIDSSIITLVSSGKRKLVVQALLTDVSNW